MKRVLSNTKYPHQLALLMPGFFFFLLNLLYSCNSGNKERSAETDSTTSNPAKVNTATNPTEKFMAGNSYAVLKLKKEDLLTLFGRNGTKKLLIQFIDSTLPSIPTKTINAVVYSAKPNGDTNGTPIYIFPENQSAPQKWDTTGAQILGTNELSEKKIRAILGNRPINETHAKDLYFYPIKRPGNHITYFVSGTLITSFFNKTSYPPDGEDANPSPPATPCSGVGCE